MWIYTTLILVLITASIYIALIVLPWLYKIYQMWVAIWPICPVKPYRIFGILPIFAGPGEDGINQFIEWTAKCPRYYGFLIPFRPSIIVHHPETMKLFLKSNEPKGLIPATGTAYRLLTPWIGDGLLNSSGEKWFRNRKLLTPGFHFNVLKPYIQIYNDSVAKTMDFFQSESNLGKSVEIYNPVSLCTLNIILKCAFSSTDDVQSEGKESKYAHAVLRMGQLIIQRTFTPHLYIDTLYKFTSKGREFFGLCDYSHKIADNVIQKRREMLQSENDATPSKRYIDFLDILLFAKDEDGKGLSDIEIRDEVETFMFEGHDTTSSGISWALYNLAKHPAIQEKAYTEVHNLLKDRKNIQWEDLNQLPYLTMCIKESLRIHPPVTNISRELTKKMYLDGHEIPPGTIIDINIFNLHHNPSVWGYDHLVYNPDRFLQENISDMDPYAFLPFSAGPRNCIGQVFAMNEMKVIIGRLLHRFVISLDESHCVERLPDLVLRPKSGIRMKFIERKSLVNTLL